MADYGGHWLTELGSTGIALEARGNQARATDHLEMRHLNRNTHDHENSFRSQNELAWQHLDGRGDGYICH